MNPTKMKKEELVQEVRTLRDKLVNQDATIDDLKQQAKEANDFRNEQESAIDNLKNALEESQEVVAKKDKELKEVKETLDSYRSDVVDKTKEIQSLREEVASKNTYISTLKSQFDESVRELNASQPTIRIWRGIAIGATIAFLITLCVMCA